MYPCGTAQASSTSSEPNAAQPWLHSDMPWPSGPCRALTSHWVTCWLALLQLSIFCLLLCSIEQRALAVVNDRLLDLSWSLLQIQKFCKSDVWYAWWSHFETGLFKIFPFFVFFFPGITCHSACGHWSLSFSLPCSDGGSCLGSSAYWAAHCQVNSMYYLCFQLLAHALDLSLDVILAFQACELLLLQVVFDELCPECWNFDNWRKFLLKKKKKSAKP